MTAAEPTSTHASGAAATGTVVAIVVSHDGERWLPGVLAGLQHQRRRPDRVVAVDTGSRDSSPALLAEALGEQALRHAPAGTSFPQAVRLGLEGAGDAEWVWLLHDDANPDPGALDWLLAAATEYPGTDVLGPKLREWPSLRRLLELGVTISGTGRRETGLERGEFDQGQHDDLQPVLAVNTAGMLVRRAVLERLGGFDSELPVFGNDLDFGWRAAAAGHTTMVVPQAVVFHAEAAHRGLRRTPLTGRSPHYAERRAALYTLLVNTRPGRLWLRWVRLLLGTLVRVLGLLLTRRVGAARDEVAALLDLYLRPGPIRRGRRHRRDLYAGDHEGVRRLLAPWWLPYRHGLDAISDLASAVVGQAQDVAERRRADRVAAVGGARVARDDEDGLGEDTGLLARFLTSPLALGSTLFLVLVVAATHEALGSVAGGALSPAPDAIGDWWALYAHSEHDLGLGSSVPAPAYLAPLAFLGTLLLGSPGAAVSAVLLLAVPVGFWGAWRFLRVVGHLLDPRGAPGWVLAWGAVTWSLLPLTSGAWGEGRLGTVALAALLPWIGHAALGLLDPLADRRWRAAWRTGLLAAVGAAFVPMAWLAAAVLSLAAAGVLRARGRLRDRGTWVPAAVAMAVPPVLLVPWWVPLVLEGAAAGLLLEAGRPPAPGIDGLGLLTGRIAGASAPWWLGAVLLVLAVLALLPRATRPFVAACWGVVVVGAAGAALLSPVTLDLSTVATPPTTSPFLLLVRAGVVVAIVIAAQGVSGRVPQPGPAPTRWLVLPLALAALLVPATGLIWSVAADQGLDDRVPEPVPAYMAQQAEASSASGVLVVEGDLERGLAWWVHRGDGTTVGEDEVVALTEPPTGFEADLRAMVSEPSPEVVGRLAERGIGHVLLPAPSDGRVSAVLDATGGLLQASAEDPDTRAWQVEESAEGFQQAGTAWWRVLVLALQAVAVLVVAVLCGPTRREEA